MLVTYPHLLISKTHVSSTLISTVMHVFSYLLPFLHLICISSSLSSSLISRKEIARALPMAVNVTSNEPDLTMPLCHGINIEEATILNLQQHLQQKHFSVEGLTECYLSRISQVNPYTKSVIEVNPDALTIARGLDSKAAAAAAAQAYSNQHRSPLWGIPFIVKDNIATGDKMQTTAGAKMLEGSKVKGDAEVVRRLREVGAVLLGKGSLSEWASMRASY